MFEEVWQTQLFSVYDQKIEKKKNQLSNFQQIWIVLLRGMKIRDRDFLLYLPSLWPQGVAKPCNYGRF